MDNRPNGGAAAQDTKLPWLTINVTDRETFAVHVSGVFPSLDYALNVLAQATRELEAQWRLARAAQYQQQQLALQQEARIRADLQRRQ